MAHDKVFIVADVSMLKDFLSPYDRVKYAAIFNLAYAGAFRLGEVVASDDTRHTIKINDVSILNGGNGLELRVLMRSFKNSRGPETLVFQSSPVLPCVVQAVNDYLAIRGEGADTLFIEHSGTPVTRHKVVRVLKRAMSNLGLNPVRFNGHSFRIGRASDLAGLGYAESQIKMVGRWRSNAYQKYIRCSDIIAPP